MTARSLILVLVIFVLSIATGNVSSTVSLQVSTEETHFLVESNTYEEEKTGTEFVSNYVVDVSQPSLHDDLRDLLNSSRIRRLQSNKLSTIRINSGSFDNYTDPNGVLWAGDVNFYGGGRYSKCPIAIDNTDLDGLYCKERKWGGVVGFNGSYIIPVVPGSYEVRLHFAEIFFKDPNKRVFNIYVQNQLVRSNLDIFIATGGQYKPMVISTSATVTSTDPVMRLKFQNVVQSAKVSGIEILPNAGSIPISPTPKPLVPPTQTSKPISTVTNKPLTTPVTSSPTSSSSLPTIRINSGSFNTYTDPNGNQWSADKSFNGGGRYNQCPESIENTDLDGVYCNERYWGGAVGFNGTYTIPVKPGSYEVRLHFAEIYFDEPNKRLFNVFVQGLLVRTNLDIVAATGGENIAIVVSTVATVTSDDPNMRLTFQNVIQSAKVSGIEILPKDGSIPISSTSPKPISKPTKNPSSASVPTPKPTNKPATKQPASISSPTFKPVAPATKQPVPKSSPTSKPAAPTTKQPVPKSSPAFKPSTEPTSAPTKSSTFQKFLINCGYNQPYTDSLAKVWSGDKYFVGGGTSSKVRSIENTVDDLLYHFERVGDPFFYEIPVPIGSYEINLLFSENEYTAARQRLFDISVEGKIEADVDIFQMAGGAFTATRLQFIVVVEDGFLTIRFTKSARFPNAGLPTLNAIEVSLDKPHISHAVATGPYAETVTDSTTNKANVQLVGQTSHTHGDGLNLVSYSWKEGSTVLGTSVNINYAFSVGNHTISLTVADDGGNEDTEVTTVTINPFGYPAITSLDPSVGTLAGGYPVIIRGTGFTYSAAQTTVTFGTTVLTGSSITIISSTSIRVIAPSSGLALNTAVIVRTPLGSSTPIDFTYQGFPIQWQEGKLLEFDRPTVGRFGPDGKLYVGTRKGRLLKVTMNEDYTSVVNTIVSFVNTNNEETM
jgi:Malectin domain/IPT/TIG domain